MTLSLYALWVLVLVNLLLTLRLGRRRRALARSRQRGLAGRTTLVEESLSVAGVLLTKTTGNAKALRDRLGAESRPSCLPTAARRPLSGCATW